MTHTWTEVGEVTKDYDSSMQIEVLSKSYIPQEIDV